MMTTSTTTTTITTTTTKTMWILFLTTLPTKTITCNAFFSSQLPTRTVPSYPIFIGKRRSYNNNNNDYYFKKKNNNNNYVHLTSSIVVSSSTSSSSFSSSYHSSYSSTAPASATSAIIFPFLQYSSGRYIRTTGSQSKDPSSTSTSTSLQLLKNRKNSLPNYYNDDDSDFRDNDNDDDDDDDEYYYNYGSLDVNDVVDDDQVYSNKKNNNYSTQQRRIDDEDEESNEINYYNKNNNSSSGRSRSSSSSYRTSKDTKQKVQTTHVVDTRTDSSLLDQQEMEEYSPPTTAGTTTTTTTKKGGYSNYYQVSFNDDVDPSETQMDWETCCWEEDQDDHHDDSTADNDDDDDYDDRTNKKNKKKKKKLIALVLLPPAAIERPRAILHFIGGTFFGSTPKLWYRQLLEGIVRNTQTAVIVTPIPITLFQSPLQHIQLSHNILQAFQYAWVHVLEDEYGAETLRDIPLCGMGHSLGARLFTVLTTANQNKPQINNNYNKKNNNQYSSSTTTSSSSSSSSSIPPYKAMILISFTNFGASTGIPGLATLLKQSRKQEQTIEIDQERQRYQNARRARNDWWLDDNDNNNDDDNENDDYERNDYEETDWAAEMVKKVQSLFQQQATRVKRALTPNVKDLEFFPTPDQLWKAIERDGRYCVNETLVVQFDTDLIDQSYKLAQVLGKTKHSTNIKFARLRGNHLTPVMTTTPLEEKRDVDGSGSRTTTSTTSSTVRGLLLGSKAGSFLWKSILGKIKTKEQEMAMRELRQSIVSYINDIVISKQE
jgi:hypothetical protein